jgi:hypothetical protein
MSKKLLNESTIRKFMKLANIDQLADHFINEADAGLANAGPNKHPAATKADPGPHKNKKATGGGPIATQGPGLVKEEELEEGEEALEEGAAELEEGEEVVEEGMGMYDEDMVDEGHYTEDEEGMADMADDMPEDPEDMGPEDAGMPEDEIEGLVAAIADAIQSHTGVAVDVAGGGDEEAAPEMDAAPPEGAEGGDMEMPAPEGEEEEVLETMGMYDEDMMDEETVVNETFRRVKARLSKMQKHEKLLESLTNKIYKRLASKNAK